MWPLLTRDFMGIGKKRRKVLLSEEKKAERETALKVS